MQRHKTDQLWQAIIPYCSTSMFKSIWTTKHLENSALYFLSVLILPRIQWMILTWRNLPMNRLQSHHTQNQTRSVAAHVKIPKKWWNRVKHCEASLNGTFSLSTHENFLTIALIHIHYLCVIPNADGSWARVAATAHSAQAAATDLRSVDNTGSVRGQSPSWKALQERSANVPQSCIALEIYS